MTLKNRIVQGMARTKLLLTGNAGKIEVAQRESGQKRAIIQLTGQWFDSIPRCSAIRYFGHVFRLLFLRTMPRFVRDIIGMLLVGASIRDRSRVDGGSNPSIPMQAG